MRLRLFPTDWEAVIARKRPARRAIRSARRHAAAFPARTTRRASVPARTGKHPTARADRLPPENIVRAAESVSLATLLPRTLGVLPADAAAMFLAQPLQQATIAKSAVMASWSAEAVLWNDFAHDLKSIGAGLLTLLFFYCVPLPPPSRSARSFPNTKKAGTEGTVPALI